MPINNETFSSPEKNSYVTTIEFNLVDIQQYKNNSSWNSKEIQRLAPAFAQLVTQSLRGMAQEIIISLPRNVSNEIFGCTIKLKLLTDKAITNQDDQIKEAIKNTMLIVFPHSCLNLELGNPFNVVSEDNPFPFRKFKNLISKKKYEYSDSGGTSGISIEFFDETDQKVIDQVSKKTYEYDRWHNITEIGYHYPEYTSPSQASIELLTQKINDYILKNPKYSSVLVSFQNSDFNQALRKICFAGNLELARLLFKHVPVRINEPSLNGLTPLDYARKSGNTELVKFLEIREGYSSLVLSQALRAEPDERIEVLRSNGKKTYNRHSLFSNSGYSADSEYPVNSHTPF